MTDSSPGPSGSIVDFHCASLPYPSFLSSQPQLVEADVRPLLSLVLRFLPVKREFFLATVAHVGMLGLFKVKT